MKSLDLSIIILNYNAKKFVIDCIRSIENSRRNGYFWEVIVVDNASTDGSQEAIRKLIENKNPSTKPYSLVLLENKENLGFSKGNNVAIPKSLGRYLLFLNPDTLVDPKTLSYMLSFMDKHKDVGVSTCKLKLPNGDLDEAAHRGFPTPWNAFCHFFGLERLLPSSRLLSGYTLGYLSKNTVHEIDSLSGAFMIVRREAGKQVDWWDEDYFWYGEDIDFCYRLKKNLPADQSRHEPYTDSIGKANGKIRRGWKIMYVPQVSILHYRGISSGVKRHSKEFSVATRKIRKMAAQASIDAMRIFYKKHYVGRYPAPVLWLVWLGIWILEKYRQIFW